MCVSFHFIFCFLVWNWIVETENWRLKRLVTDGVRPLCAYAVYLFRSSLPIHRNDEYLLITLSSIFIRFKILHIFRRKDDDEGNCWKSSSPPALSLGCYPVLPVVSRWWISRHSALVQSICLFIYLFIYFFEISLSRMHTRINMIIIIHIVDI